jgi:hypothetical protein
VVSLFSFLYWFVVFFHCGKARRSDQNDHLNWDFFVDAFGVPKLPHVMLLKECMEEQREEYVSLPN